VVGLDTLVLVANGLTNNVPNDEERATFQIPGFIAKMLENKWLGSKTNQGFFKMLPPGTDVSGKNGGPSKVQKIKVNHANKLTPHLKPGTQINLGDASSYQFGHEGKNVMVTSIIPNDTPASLYKGCYTAANPKMSYVDNDGKVSTSKPTSANYTYDSCRTASISVGQRYFGFQEMNINTGLGYCAVSNAKPPALSESNTSYIIPPANIKSLWSSSDVKDNGPSRNVVGSSLQLNSQGGLVIKDSAGSVVKTIHLSGTNFAGCYLDNRGDKRNFPRSGNGKNYNYDSCKALATSNDANFFALQNESGGKFDKTVKAECWYGKDEDYARILKDPDFPAINSKNSRGGYYQCHPPTPDTRAHGGPSVNAIYRMDPIGTYYLIVKDDGTVALYKASNKVPAVGTENIDSKDVLIWSIGKAGTSIDPDPEHSANVSKYGNILSVTKNSSNATLAQGDFIGSMTGKAYLKMESSGDLVLYTSKREINCKTNRIDGKTGGGKNANAIYDIGIAGVPSDVGKAAYIDGNGTMHAYPDSMITSKSNYDYYTKKGIPLSLLAGNAAIVTNRYYNSLNDAQTACNLNPKCNSIVEMRNTYNPTYWLYSNKLGEPLVENDRFNSTTYFRSPKIESSGSCAKGFVEIDSLSWERYAKNNGGLGDPMTSTTDCTFGETEIVDPSLNQLARNVQYLRDKIQEKSRNWVSRTTVANSRQTGNTGEDRTNTLTHAQIDTSKANEKETVTRAANTNQIKAGAKKKSGPIVKKQPTKQGMTTMQESASADFSHHIMPKDYLTDPKRRIAPPVSESAASGSSTGSLAPATAGLIAPTQQEGKVGFTNMNSVINRIVNDSSIQVSQQNYEYILWILLAILSIAIFIRLRRK
jgi:hypothetical protein